MKNSTHFILDLSRSIGKTKMLAYCSVLLVFYTLFSLQPFFLAQVLSSFSKNELKTGMVYLVLVFFSFLSTSILNFFNNDILQSIRKLSKALIWRQNSDKDYFYFVDNEVGEVQNLIAEVSYSARFLQYESLQLLVRTAIIVVTYSIILGQHGAILSFCYVAFYALYFLLSIRLSRNKSQGITEALNASSEVNSLIIDVYKNIETIKSSNADEVENARFTSALENERVSYLELQRSIDYAHLVQQTAITLISIGIITFSMFRHNVASLDITVILIIVYSAFNLDSFGKDFLALLEHRDRMDIALGKLEYNRKKESSGESMWVSRADSDLIQTRDLTYAYRGKCVLNRVNLEIMEKEKIAIVGENGSGKTTLLKLLGGIIQRFDGKIVYNTKYIGDISQVRYYSQASSLFDRSIFENIVYPQKAYSIASILEIVDRLSLGSLIASEDDLLNKKPGDFGARFSGGEKQKILIARAIVNKVPVMLFDEVTSSLDRETEKTFSDVVDEFFGECTILSVTHKKDYLATYDRVIEMNNINNLK